MAQKTILSGMRPTGRLHLGNYVGALANWIRLQDEYHCFFEVADWHAITTAYEHSGKIAQNSMDVALDWLASGIDPKRSVVFVQSDVKEHAELYLLLSMLVTTARLERNPTLKEQVRDLELGENLTYGHLGYPVLQAADILMYKADAVPVGEDQLPHLEITREIARRFNGLYGEVFPVPEPLLTEFARLPGLDTRRMSKSLGNAILISDPPDVIAKKVKTAVTDPEKIHMGDPGHPDICTIYAYQRRFNAAAAGEIRATCIAGTRGCVACKKEAGEAIAAALEPVRAERARLEQDLAGVRRILDEGRERAGQVARATMADVRGAMGFGR